LSIEREFDVVVVGGGPAGSTAARALAERGFHTALVEEHEAIGSPVNCSGIVGVEAVERFDLPRSLIRHTLDGVEFRSPRGARHVFRAGRPLAHVLDRTALDRELARRAQAVGVALLLSHRVVGLRRQSRGIELTFDGESTRPLRARAMVLATGAGVSLLKTLDLGGYPGWVLGAQTEVVLADAESVEIHLGKRWAPEGFAWIVPLGQGMAKVGLLTHRDGPEYLRRFLERPEVRTRVAAKPTRIRSSVLPLGFLPRSFADRLLVVGEAAGHIKATTCGGIYYGMLAAELAAEVLERALKEDRFDAVRLSEYEKRWRALLGSEIETGLRARRAFHSLSDDQMERLVSIAFEAGVLDWIREEADFDWHQELIRAVFRHQIVGRLLWTALRDRVQRLRGRGAA